MLEIMEPETGKDDMPLPFACPCRESFQAVGEAPAVIGRANDFMAGDFQILRPSEPDRIPKAENPWFLWNISRQCGVITLSKQGDQNQGEYSHDSGLSKWENSGVPY